MRIYIKHGLKGTRAYESWKNMMRRCYGKLGKENKNYRKFGIKVCESWLNPVNFVNDMGEPEAGLTLERINNRNDYYKENCRWATRKEQIINRSNMASLEFNGIVKTRPEWADILKINPKFRKVFLGRLFNKWSLAKAACTPYDSSKLKKS